MRFSILSHHISNALTLRKDKSILLSRILIIIKNLSKSPPAPGKNMQAIHSAANFKYILAISGVYFVYTGNSFSFEELLSIFSNITSLLPNGSCFKASFIHISNIQFLEVKIFNPYDSSYMLTHMNSGLDIVSNIGNRGFNYNPKIIYLPRHYLMPLIGYIVYIFYNLDYSKALLNL